MARGRGVCATALYVLVCTSVRPGASVSRSGDARGICITLAIAQACALAAGIMLAIFPIRRGERWALGTSFAMWTILFLTRLYTDPRCLVVLDPHQHGCHTFMIAVLLGIVGLVLTR